MKINIGRVIIAIALLGVAYFASHVFFSSISPLWVICLVAGIIATPFLYWCFTDSTSREEHHSLLKKHVLWYDKLERYWNVAGGVFVTVAIAAFLLAEWMSFRIFGWFLPKGFCFVIGLVTWTRIYFWKMWPWFLTYTETNTGGLVNNDVLKKIDPLKSQRELRPGFNPIIPGIESIVGDPISTKWIQILVPNDFRAQTSDGVEVGLGETYLRIKVPHGKLKIANTHGMQEIIQAFRTRMTGWLTTEIRKISHVDLPSQRKALEAAYVDEFKPGTNDPLERKYGGIIGDEMRIGDIILPDHVIASNELGVIMGSVGEQTDKLITLSKNRISWEKALLFVCVALGKMDTGLAFLATIGTGLFGGGQGNKNKQNNGGNQQGGNQNNQQQGQQP